MEANVRDRKIYLKKSISYIMAPPSKYDNAEDRIKAYKAQQNNYSMKNWRCEVCDCVIKLGNRTKHQSSIKHFNRANGSCAKTREDKLWRCEACDIEIHVHSKDNHLKSARHVRNTMKKDGDEEEILTEKEQSIVEFLFHPMQYLMKDEENSKQISDSL
jgi:ribosomal protein L37AE/L43A